VPEGQCWKAVAAPGCSARARGTQNLRFGGLSRVPPRGFEHRSGSGYDGGLRLPSGATCPFGPLSASSRRGPFRHIPTRRTSCRQYHERRPTLEQDMRNPANCEELWIANREHVVEATSSTSRLGPQSVRGRSPSARTRMRAIMRRGRTAPARGHPLPLVTRQKDRCEEGESCGRRRSLEVRLVAARPRARCAEADRRDRASPARVGPGHGVSTSVASGRRPSGPVGLGSATRAAAGRGKRPAPAGF